MIADTEYTQKQKTGTNMFSGFGKITAYNYQCFQAEDPMSRDAKVQAKLKKKAIMMAPQPTNGPLTADQVKLLEMQQKIAEENKQIQIVAAQQKRANEIRDAEDERMRQELENYNMFKFKKQALIQKKNRHKHQQLQDFSFNNEPKILSTATQNATNYLDNFEMKSKESKGKRDTQQTFKSAQNGSRKTQSSNFRESMTSKLQEQTTPNDKEPQLPQSQSLKPLKGTANFKACTREESHKITGYLFPSYQKHFRNDLNRYHPKKAAPKLAVDIKFDPKTNKARQASEAKICQKGLHKLAVMALDLKDTIGLKPSFSSRQHRLIEKHLSLEVEDKDSKFDDSAVFVTHKNDSATYQHSKTKNHSYFNSIEESQITSVNQSQMFNQSSQLSKKDKLEKDKRKFLENASLEDLKMLIKDKAVSMKDPHSQFMTHNNSVLSTYQTNTKLLSVNGYPNLSSDPNDIGKQSRNTIEFDKQPVRKMYHASQQGAHEGRFERQNYSMEKLSQHKKSPMFRLQAMSSRQDLFSKGIHQIGKPNNQKQSETAPTFYDHARTKLKTMKRTDFKVPVFSKGTKRPSQVIKHDYQFQTQTNDPEKFKNIFNKFVYNKDRRPLPFDKQTGRDDNFLFNQNEGYNIDSKPKTYFDANNLFNILDPKLMEHTQKASEMNLRRISRSPTNQGNSGAASPTKGKSVYDLDLEKDKIVTDAMTLEEKILAGVFKPNI